MVQVGRVNDCEEFEFEALMDRLQCPRTHSHLVKDGAVLRSATGNERYAILDGIPDLRRPPERLTLDLDWFEPWEEFEALDLSAPPRHSATDLPHHLDSHLASIPGDEGGGRWILEVGCGERLCEAYFSRRNFHYVGIDVDDRGRGPHLLADAHNLPFAPESFDLYTSMAVYEHLVSPLRGALEAFRILRPGGLFFGTAAFVYGFHDRASFHHMTHGGLLWTFRMAGFEVERIWSDWDYTDSIPEMAFGAGLGEPWRLMSSALLKGLDWSFVHLSNLIRPLVRRPSIDLDRRRVERAGSLSFVARKPLG